MTAPGLASSLPTRSSGNEHRDSGSKEEVKRLAIAVEEKRGVRIDLGRRTPADVAPSDPVLYAALTQLDDINAAGRGDRTR